MGGFKGTSFQFLTDESLTGPVFGRKPDVPPIESLNLSDEQLKAIAANIAAAPEAQKLAGLTADEIDRLIAREVPGLKGIGAQISENLGDWSRGNFGNQLSAYIQRTDAAKAFAGGYTGTGMHAGLTARDLGMTGYEVQRAAIPLTESWLAAAERLYSPAVQAFQSMMLTPEQMARFDVEERNTQWQRSWLKEQIAAMPDPAARGIYDTLMGLISAYLGASYSPYRPNYNTTPVTQPQQPAYSSGWESWAAGQQAQSAPYDRPYNYGAGVDYSPESNMGGGGGGMSSGQMGALAASFI